MGKNELSEAGTSMVRDNMANFRRDTRKTRVTGYPGEKACFVVTPWSKTYLLEQIVIINELFTLECWSLNFTRTEILQSY